MGYSKVKLDSQHGKLEFVSLNDVPLEVRRREANEPLFLIRYE